MNIRPGTLYLLLPLALAPLSAPGASPSPTPTPTPGHVLTSATPVPAARSGGSLADTVRRAKASATPAPKKKSLGTITNESLKKSPEPGAKGSVQVGPSHPIADLPSPPAPSSRDASEQEWRRRAADARARIETAEADVKRLEQETKKLENDFYAWSDGNYRDRVIKPAWDQARDDLKKARQELDAAQNAMADLEDEARKAGAPPGWLRP